MEELSINEALNVAQQMRNFFKAFKKLDEFINFVVLTEQEMSEKNKKKGELQEEIRSLENKFQELKSLFKKTTEEIQGELIAEKEASEKQKAKLKEDLENDKALFNEEIEQMDFNLKLKTQTSKAKIEDFNKREKDALDKTLEAEGKLEEIRKKIKGIEI